MVADVSNPSAPQVVGDVALPDILVEVAVSGGYAHVAERRAGLRMIDVQAPSAPVEVGASSTSGTPGHVARDVTVSGSYAYVVAGNDGVRVISVSTPGTPVEGGSVEASAFEEAAVALFGGHVLVTGGITGISVFAGCGFSDGLESGDSSAWSATVP